MEQREQEYQELLKRHKKDIAAVIKRYQEQNQRLEYEDLQQEVVLQLWLAMDRVLGTRNPRAYIKHLAARAVKAYIERFKQDALYDASSLDEVFPEADNDGDEGQYRPKRIAYEASHYPASSRSHWQDDPPAKCNVRSCKSREFRLVYDGRGLPWWECTCGHRVFGYWRTEAQVKWALKRYRFMLGDCIRSSWIARAANGKRTSYASWEAIIDTKVDLERAVKVLDWGERQLVKLRYEDGMSVKDLAGRYGASIRMVKYWFAKIARKIAVRIGPRW